MERNQLLKFYFQLRDGAASFTGYSKLELHQIVKAKLFLMMADDEDNFNLDKISLEEINNQKQLSLTMLSDKGLEVFVEGFRSFCVDNFNFYL